MSVLARWFFLPRSWVTPARAVICLVCIDGEKNKEPFEESESPSPVLLRPGLLKGGERIQLFPRLGVIVGWNGRTDEQIRSVFPGMHSFKADGPRSS